ncbi:hypothetical protein GGH12_005441 [Coemansia sp. RSA 1822]|nr:hypothetical protein LPJ76_005570 [Coemansia sp. RSA 638]KAJ2543433.1 hypothetical protein GGF49_002038 [Coemansia sp. RSA 1853]KAJ2559329.1 hypothetical protein GGH12_005441 [Coemansia sp. RSA 1822]
MQILSQTKVSISFDQLTTLAREFVAAHSDPSDTSVQLEAWRGRVMSEFSNSINDMCTVSRLLGKYSPDKAMAFALLKVAAECGDHDAAFNYGIQLSRGKIMIPGHNSIKAGILIIKTLSKLGHPMSQVTIAEIMFSSKDLNERTRGIEMMKKAAEGTPVACFKLGEVYRKTSVVPRDISLAKMWHIKSAKRGIAASYFTLGVILSTGEGVLDKKPDFAGALKMFELGAAAGNVESMYNAGMYHLEGKGTKKNAEMAVEYLVLAASQKFPIALLTLGKLFIEGAEVHRDLKRGRNYLAIAKECGGADGFIGKQADMVLEKHKHLEQTQCIIM